MNITFLIGNGFDLNLGLKTSYDEFLTEYNKIPTASGSVLEYFKTDILKNRKLWANAEEAFGKSTATFKTDNRNAQDFCECHEDFCYELARYLSSQESRLNYAELEPHLIKGLAKGLLNYKNGFRAEVQQQINAAQNTFSGGFKYNFINFNYTQTLDSAVGALKGKDGTLGIRSTSSGSYTNSIGQVLHIHGTTNRDMVLGVNDVSQITDTSLFDGYEEEYIGQIIKPKTNELNQENNEKKVIDVLNSSDLIYVYGMSIGLTDRIWWERICELMHSKNNLHLIIHEFNAPEDGLIRRAFLSFVRKRKKEFTAYCQLDGEAKKEIENRIHIDRTNIFDGLEGLVRSAANKKELITV